MTYLTTFGHGQASSLVRVLQSLWLEKKQENASKSILKNLVPRASNILCTSMACSSLVNDYRLNGFPIPWLHIAPFACLLSNTSVPNDWLQNNCRSRLILLSFIWLALRSWINLWLLKGSQLHGVNCQRTPTIKFYLPAVVRCPPKYRSGLPSLSRTLYITVLLT